MQSKHWNMINPGFNLFSLTVIIWNNSDGKKYLIFYDIKITQETLFRLINEDFTPGMNIRKN